MNEPGGLRIERLVQSATERTPYTDTITVVFEDGVQITITRERFTYNWIETATIHAADENDRHCSMVHAAQ